MSTRFHQAVSLVNYTVKMKPITPIHVWAGTNVTIDMDAFVENDDLYVMSAEYLDLLPADMLSNVLQITAKSSVEAFKEVFRILRRRGAIQPVAKIKTRITSGAQVRLMHGNIVPGSTLKGYIRTAMLRHLITQLPANISASVIRKGINFTVKPARVSEGLEASLLRKPRPKTQGGFVDAMEILMVSDPKVVEKRLSVRKLSVVYKFNPKNVIAEILAVVMDPTEGEALRFNLTINTLQPSIEGIASSRRLDPHITRDLVEIVGLKKGFASRLPDRHFIVKALRDHGCKLIELELGKLHETLVDYRRLLEDMKSRLCGEDTSCVPARIGFMTGHEAKTVIDLVAKHTPDIYNDAVNFMQQQVGHTWNALTIKLVDYDGKIVGVGWCELCLE